MRPSRRVGPGEAERGNGLTLGFARRPGAQPRDGKRRMRGHDGGAVQRKGPGMILRVVTLMAGMTGAAGLSQFPEFSQQYTQRLGGAVDELSRVVADFDASARAEGLSRSEALEQMTGTGFLDRRRADLARSFARHDRLSADLAALTGAGPFQRAYHAARISDPDLARATLRAYRPAVPVTFEGASFAALGFVAGWGVVAGLWSLLRLPLRRRARG